MGNNFDLEFSVKGLSSNAFKQHIMHNIGCRECIFINPPNHTWGTNLSLTFVVKGQDHRANALFLAYLVNCCL